MRTATWTSVGKNVEDCKNLDSVLKESNLDYTVGFMPIQLENGIEIPNKLATVREDNNHVYGVVSRKYKIVQNREAFEFVDYMCDEISYERAGETYTGIVYIIAKLPDTNVLGDVFTPYVIFRNGFTGCVKITAAICPLRIVCENQFNWSFKNTNNSITIRHMGNIESKMKAASNILKMTADFMIELKVQAEKFAAIKFTESEVKRIIDRTFYIDPAKEISNIVQKRLDESKANFMSAYLCGDNSNFKGTGWGLINAYSDFITHKQISGQESKKDDNRFMATVFSPNLMSVILKSMSTVNSGVIL